MKIQRKRVKIDILSLYECSLDELLLILNEIKDREKSGELENIQIEKECEIGDCRMYVTAFRLETDEELDRRILIEARDRKLKRDACLGIRQKEFNEYKRLKKKFKKSKGQDEIDLITGKRLSNE